MAEGYPVLPVQSVPVAAAPALPPGLPPDRVEAAYKIGQFLRRCLSGGPRVLQEGHPFHCRALSTLFARATTSRSTTLLGSTFLGLRQRLWCSRTGLRAHPFSLACPLLVRLALLWKLPDASFRQPFSE